MGDAAPRLNKVTTIMERLTNAEKQLKLLLGEIRDIKSELAGVEVISYSFNRQFSSATSPTTSTTKRAASEDIEESNPSTKQARYENQMEDQYVVVYTDGACENNGRYNAKAGIGVWFGDDHPLNISEPVIGRATNNTAEIQACTRAINNALENGITKLKIKTDSQFVVNSMTQWINKWRVNDWKVVSGGDVKNKEDFIMLDDFCRRMQDVKWEHVYGHRGIHGNEAADRLARAGAAKYKK